MATTLSLQNTINFVMPFLKNQPLQVSNQEPALTAANIVLATMLGAPLRWRFNRATTNFAITGSATDYVQSLPNLGFIETQWLLDGLGNIYQLAGAVSLAVDKNAQRPAKIAAQYDDNAGNITFRMSNIPDQNYTVYLDYQKKMTLMTSAASFWGTVPDEFNHIFNWGFLCILSLLINDSRFPIYEKYFIARLLGAQDGLTDQERNIFLANWMQTAGTVTRAQGAVNSGVAGRGI